jgi:hypothetical protein
LPRLTLQEYLVTGRLPGLESRAVQTQVSAAVRKSRLSDPEILSVMLCLFDRKNGQSRSHTCSEISGALAWQTSGEKGNGPRHEVAVANALRYLEDVNIVRRRIIEAPVG